MMLHTALISAHAASGIAAFLFGILALRLPTRGISIALRSYLGALGLMVLLLFLVVALDWPQLDPLARSLYAALTALALYTGWRGWQALRTSRHRVGAWQASYIDHIGFTLITLFDGFVIVGALDLGAPLWSVILLGVLGVLVGLLGVRRIKDTEMMAT